MQPEFVRKVAFTVSGIAHRGPLDGFDFDQIWMKEFMAFAEEVTPLSIDGAYYGVWFPVAREGHGDYVAGMAVPETAEVPVALTMRPVSGGDYAVFACTVATIGETWDGVHDTWLAANPGRHDASRPAFEFYPPDCTDANSPVYCYLPVLR